MPLYNFPDGVDEDSSTVRVGGVTDKVGVGGVGGVRVGVCSWGVEVRLGRQRLRHDSPPPPPHKQ